MCEDNNAEFSGLNVHDLLGLSQPLTKLMETVSSGIGTLYEPVHAKRMAKAKAFELQLISSTVNNNLQLPVKYEDGHVTIDSTDANQLVQRAESRFLFQEMKKQQNIESVIEVAHSSLEKVSSVSATPVDSDWISTFFDSVANVSNEDMQLLWGKVLAGEVEHPGSFSLRTLNVLKNLTQKEASIFCEISPYILRCPGNREGTIEDYFLMCWAKENGQNNLEEYNIPFVKIMLLSEAGLVCDNTAIYMGFELNANEDGFIKGTSSSIHIKNMSTTGLPLNIQHGAYFLTEAGKELFSISFPNECQNYSDKYIAECLEQIRSFGIVLKKEHIEPDGILMEIV